MSTFGAEGYGPGGTCPFCGARAETTREEIAHMESRHPEVIRQRLREIGHLADASDLRYQADLVEGPGGEVKYDVRVMRDGPPGIKIAEGLYAASREEAVARAQKIADGHREEVAQSRAAVETVDLT